MNLRKVRAFAVLLVAYQFIDFLYLALKIIEVLNQADVKNTFVSDPPVG